MLRRRRGPTNFPDSAVGFSGISSAQHELGYTAQYDLEAGIRDFADWIKSCDRG